MGLFGITFSVIALWAWAMIRPFPYLGAAIIGLSREFGARPPSLVDGRRSALIV
jgi:hypothetical protein